MFKYIYNPNSNWIETKDRVEQRRKYQGEIQYAYRKIHSSREALERGYIKKERNRLYKEQEVRTLEKKYRTIRENKG